MAVRRLENVGIVVEDLEAAKAFFAELGLELEGETTVEGPAIDDTVGLDDVRSDIAMMRTPDGHSRIELTRYQRPASLAGDGAAPPNVLGAFRVMFSVDDIDDTVARLQAHGGTLVGRIAVYEDIYKLCYLRGPEGIIVALAEQLRPGDPLAQ
jgi:catechol 2,3-dioxygenase-like lactoylglutathione lyase family enzyme